MGLETPDKGNQSFEKNLFFFWTSRTLSESLTPRWMQDSIDEWLVHNPTFKAEVINDQGVMDLLNGAHPELRRMYSRITIPACKSDIARVVYLYTYGGVYVDGHTACKQSLFRLLEDTKAYDVIFPLHPNHMAAPKSSANPFRTGVLIAKKGNPLFRELIEDFTRDLSAIAELQKQYRKYDYDVSELTGPRFIARKLRGEPDVGSVESESNAIPRGAHCGSCAQMGNTLTRFNATVVDVEDYVEWHKFSDYRLTADNKLKDSHWSVLQTKLDLFDFDRC